MSATSGKSGRKTSKATDRFICSPALAAGQEPSNSQDGPPADLFGRPVVLAPPSPSPARKRHARRAQAACLCGALDELVTQYARTAATLGLPTPATYGRKFGGSQPSEDLNSSLANRLKASMPSTGSPEYELRWKSSVTLLGLTICRLRARERRKSDSAFGGWPSPRANKWGPPDSHGKVPEILAGWVSPTAQDHSRGNKPPRPHDTGVPLSQQVVLAGWAAPRQTDGSKNVRTVEGAIREMERKGANNDLGTTAALAGWTTPQAHDAQGKSNPDRLLRHGTKHGCRNLNDEAGLASGPTSTSSPAETEKRGALNPAFSLWLQGFPPQWMTLAPSAASVRSEARATRSVRRSPPSSSAR